MVNQSFSTSAESTSAISFRFLFGELLRLTLTGGRLNTREKDGLRLTMKVDGTTMREKMGNKMWKKTSWFLFIGDSKEFYVTSCIFVFVKFSCAPHILVFDVGSSTIKVFPVIKKKFLQ